MTVLKCVYINLDRATARRQALEASFAQHAPPQFELVRFPAITAADVEALNVPGKLRANERACFMSHQQVIMNHPKGGPPLMVVEDDVEFGSTFFRRIGGLLNNANAPEILFTDICVPGAGLMSELASVRPKLASAGQLAFFNLANIGFAGAAAYIIHPRALAKVQAYLGGVNRFDFAYDMYLRALVKSGRLSASVAFPFLTTLSNLSEDSAVQPEDSVITDLIWNTFRKVMWADRDLERCAPLLNHIREACCDAESLMLSPLLCAQASVKYRSK